MLNSIIIMGRLTNFPEVKTTQSGISVCSFTVAVDRQYANNGQRETDFIDCVAWRNTADFVGKWFTKGQMIAVQGELQTRNYEDKNGNKRKATEIVVSNVSFCGNKEQEGNGLEQTAQKQDNKVATKPTEHSQGTFTEIPDEDDLPF